PPTQETRLIVQVAAELLDRWFEEQPRVAVRLLGVGVSDLSPARQLDLFTSRESAEAKALDHTLDRIHDKFGTDAVKRGTDH
ncbi:MAG: DNA polymerase IV, partial [Steroidobacteraceae bacterium]